jgi:hypothetical protein
MLHVQSGSLTCLSMLDVLARHAGNAGWLYWLSFLVGFDGQAGWRAMMASWICLLRWLPVYAAWSSMPDMQAGWL